MADFSDDDDDLLSSPTFKAKAPSRRNDSRKEDKMLDYLSSCLEEGQAREDRKHRMDQLQENYHKSSTTGEADNSDKNSDKNSDNEKEDYWKSVDDAAKGGDTQEIRRRKRELDDAINGVDLSQCSYIGENIEEGDDERRKRVAAANASCTGLSTNLGVRRVFWPIRHKKGVVSLSVDIFGSEAEAMKQLDTILRTMAKSQRGKKKNEIISSLSKAREMNLIPMLLTNGQLCKISRKKKCPIPRNIIKWLLEVAFSGKFVSAYLSSGAKTTMSHFMGDCGDDISFFKVEEFDMGLRVLFGLINNDPLRSQLQGGLTEDEDVDGLGLKHYLEIWCLAFEKNLVIWPKKDYNDKGEKVEFDSSDETICALATRSLQALIRSSLDPLFHSGLGLMETLQRVICTVIQTMDLHFRDLPTEMDKWIKHTSKEFISVTSNLSSGKDGTADQDDTEGFLPLALAVRNIPTIDLNGVIIKACTSFKIAVAELALQHCMFIESNNWTNLLKEQTQNKQLKKEGQTKENSDWLFPLIAAQIGFSEMQTKFPKFRGSPPRFHAALEITSICVMSGQELFSLQKKSPESAAIIAQILQSCEDYCLNIKKDITAVFVQPHLRRVKEFLTWLWVCYSHNKLNITGGGAVKGVKFQSSLDCWIDNVEDGENMEDNSQHD